jgi:hypothetical protein
MPRSFMPLLATLAFLAITHGAGAQLSPPNAAGVAMGHLH